MTKIKPQQVALITGASSGIGHDVALAFARKGIHVIALARRSDRLNVLEREFQALPEPHGDILAIVADVQEPDALKSAANRALGRFGRLDILVANAGIGYRGDLVNGSWTDIETVLRTNIDGVLHSIRAAVPAMRQNGGGHIVIISSVAAHITMPYAAVYAASKAFVSSIAGSMRLELEDDHILVTEMLVGRTATEFNEKRLGKKGRTGSGIPTMHASEVANAIMRAIERRQKRVFVRLFDRLLLWANALAPNFVGRRALKQYK